METLQRSDRELGGSLAESGVTRRIFLSTSTLALAGIALTGCDNRDAVVLDLTDVTDFSTFDRPTATTLLDVADLMIPRTETPGAGDTATIQYLDQLMDRWASRASQAEILDFPAQLDRHAHQRAGRAYRSLTREARFELLTDMDNVSFADGTKPDFARAYRKLKRLIFHIHYTSEAANPDYLAVPGQYRGNVSEAEYQALVDDARF